MQKTQLNIRIDQELLNLIKKHSRKEGISVSEFVTRAITTALNNNQLEESSNDILLRLEELEQRIKSLEN